MFGGGWTEMLIIGVVALVVIGPKDLPIVMRKVGRMVGTVRRMGGEFQRELNKTTGLDQITDLRRSITEPLRQTSDEIVREFNKITTTGVEPSGIVKPADPKVESVYETIAANSSVTPAAGEAAPAGIGPAEPSPAPAEALAPARPKRASRTKSAAKPATAKVKPAKPRAAASRAKPAAADGPVAKPAAKPRVRSAAAKAQGESVAKAPAAAPKPRPRAKKA